MPPQEVQPASPQPSAQPIPPKQSSNKNLYLIIITLLVLLILVIVGGFGAYALLGKKKGCTYNNAKYANGDSFKSTDGCNTCSCSDGNVACTEMYCYNEDNNDQEMTQETTVQTEENEVSVYFAKPGEITDYDTLEMVTRKTTEENLYVFAMNQLLLGPTTAEKSADLLAPFTLEGSSNCDGDPYKLITSGSTITVEFCKEVVGTENPGTTDHWAGFSLSVMSRVITSIDQTLKFGEITTVIIKDMDGNCYGMDTGLNVDCSE